MCYPAWGVDNQKLTTIESVAKTSQIAPSVLDICRTLGWEFARLETCKRRRRNACSSSPPSLDLLRSAKHIKHQKLLTKPRSPWYEKENHTRNVFFMVYVHKLWGVFQVSNLAHSLEDILGHKNQLIFVADLSRLFDCPPSGGWHISKVAGYGGLLLLLE